MKRYKLLKDLPTFNKGDVFYLGALGGLIREKDGVIAYAESTLERFNILDSDWFEEIPEGYKRWRADRFDWYWYVGACGAVSNDRDSGVSIDDMRYELGNYFKTEEEAQKAAEWLKAFTTLRDDTKGFKPDWDDPEQDKWSVYYDHASRSLWSDLNFTFQFGNLCFASEDDADASIKNHQREWLTFFGVEKK